MTLSSRSKVYFFFYLYAAEDNTPKRYVRKYLLIIRLVSKANFHKQTAGIRYITESLP
jgi:hypothetical protein